MSDLDTGYVTERTMNRMSLAWALGYRPLKINGRYGMYELVNRFNKNSRKLRGWCAPENLYRWLEQRHDLEVIDTNYRGINYIMGAF